MEPSVALTNGNGHDSPATPEPPTSSFDPAIFRSYLLPLLPALIGALPEELEAIFDRDFEERVMRFAGEGGNVIHVVKSIKAEGEGCQVLLSDREAAKDIDTKLGIPMKKFAEFELSLQQNVEIPKPISSFTLSSNVPQSKCPTFPSSPPKPSVTALSSTPSTAPSIPGSNPSNPSPNSTEMSPPAPPPKKSTFGSPLNAIDGIEAQLRSEEVNIVTDCLRNAKRFIPIKVVPAHAKLQEQNATSETASPSFLYVPPNPRAKPPQRPASPIVFAKGRAISPIRFAPSGSPKTSLDHPGGSEGSSHEEGTIISMDCEEDDEWGDSNSELSFSRPIGGGRFSRLQNVSCLNSRLNPSHSHSVAIKQDSHSHQQSHLQPHHSKHHYFQFAVAPAQKFSTYDTRGLMLIRFSTGQALDDHSKLAYYSLSPHEIHRIGEIFTLPRTVIDLYVQPYWEGWVKSLRVVVKEQVPMSKKSKGKRLGKDRENKIGSTTMWTRLLRGAPDQRIADGCLDVLLR
ncbi:dynein heavy chain, partial [Marasmius crinis-equi]